MLLRPGGRDWVRPTTNCFVIFLTGVRPTTSYFVIFNWGPANRQKWPKRNEKQAKKV